MLGCLVCRKNHIFFSICSEKMVFSKIVLEYDISCIIRKDDISFPRKYHLILQTENERWSFSKKYMVIWYFLLSDILYCLEKWNFFPEDMILFFRWKMEDDLPQKRYMEIWCFLYICINVTNVMLPFR